MRPTKAGWTFIFLLVWVPLAAIATANNFLFLFFAMLIGLALVSERLGRKNIRSIDVQRFIPEEIFAETRFRMLYEIGTGLRPWGAEALTLVEEIPLELGGGPKGLPQIAPGEPKDVAAFYSIAKRGDHEIGPVRIHSTFPFGLATYTRVFGGSRPVLVFPRIDSVDAEVPFQLGSMGKGVEQADPFGTIPHHFREYVAGDPYKHIEWKMSARTGKLVTKVHSEEGAPEMVVRLSASASEHSISRAASLIVCLAEQGVPVSLAGPGLKTETGTRREHVRKLLTILARWEDPSSPVETPDRSWANVVEIDQRGEFRWMQPGETHG
jgi:uncharacterized protein (DUF58 family)